MSTKSHNLNLYSPDELSAVRITVVDDKATFHGDVPIQFDSRVDFTDNVGTIIHQDLSAKLTTMTTDITNATVSPGTTPASTVQGNLDTYIASNDPLVAANTTAITTEATDRANAISAATTTVTGLINDEATARSNADSTLTSNLSTEISNRTTAVANEATTRSTAVSDITALIDTERGRIDDILSGSSVNLDSLAEIVSAYESADNSLLATLTSIQSSMNTLQAQVNELTDDGSFTPTNVVLFVPNSTLDSTTDYAIEYYSGTDHFFLEYGIDEINIKSAGFKISFTDLDSYNEWRAYTLPTATRNVTIASTNGTSYPDWEGTHALNESTLDAGAFTIDYTLGSLTTTVVEDLANHVAAAGAGNDVVSLAFT